MDILKEKHDIIISLGATCFIKGYLKENDITQKTYLFDWIGTSMWGICDLVRQDFRNMFNMKNYKYMITAEKEKLMVVNTLYYLLLKHNFPEIMPDDEEKDELQKKYLNEKTFAEFKTTYFRRSIELRNILNRDNKILFIRHEQYMDTRIIYPEYEKRFEVPEFEHLKEFSNLLKEKNPDLKFNIIYISHTKHNEYVPDHNIIILESEITDWDECAGVYNKLFDTNREFISKLNL